MGPFLYPHFPWQVRAILIAMVAVAVAMPFGRREDWIGLLAFLIVWTSAIGLWALVIGRFLQKILEWWRHRSDPN